MPLNGHRPPIKQKWLDRVIEVHNFHINQVKIKDGWTITDTAELLQRSYGGVAEDLLLGKWLKTHHNQIAKFKNYCDAIAYVRKKRNEMDLTEIDA